MYENVQASFLFYFGFLNHVGLFKLCARLLVIVTLYEHLGKKTIKIIHLGYSDCG